jgi:thiosulfate/3-mercaptopyruvate sulfurtransferase
MQMSTATFDPGAYKRTTTELRVDPAWIAEHLDDQDLRLIEVDVSPAAYDAGHVPGAVLWNAYSDLRRPDYSPVTSDDVAALLSRSGIERSSTIVLYGYAAYLGFWLMKSIGHERVLLMDGPRERWEQAGYQWTRQARQLAAASYPAPAGDEPIVASREEVTRLIGRPVGLVLDVRSQAEFEGERFWPSGATEDTGRSGHIPGAVHLPFDLLLDEDRRLKPAADIKAIADAHGVDPGGRIVTYCTIGNRASVVWFALSQVLGFPDVAVYYGSWVQWGKCADTPIEGP